VLTDPDTGESLIVDPSADQEFLTINKDGFSTKVAVPLDESSDLAELQRLLKQAVEENDKAIPDQRGWANREFAEDDAFSVSFAETTAEDEGSVSISGRTSGGQAASVGPISIGLALGLHDELDSYIVTP
jgi:L-lactate utilization protein LutC